MSNNFWQCWALMNLHSVSFFMIFFLFFLITSASCKLSEVASSTAKVSMLEFQEGNLIMNCCRIVIILGLELIHDTYFYIEASLNKRNVYCISLKLELCLYNFMLLS